MFFDNSIMFSVSGNLLNRIAFFVSTSVVFFQLFGGGGAIEPWDCKFRCFLKNASRSQLLVDWIILRYPQDTVGDYVLDNMLQVGIFPRFNPRSEIRWHKKDEPFMQFWDNKLYTIIPNKMKSDIIYIKWAAP